MTGNSLRAFDSIADRIRQHRQVSKAPLLVVEGPDDLLVLEGHLAGVEIFGATGKPSVLEALDRVDAWNLERVYGLVDRDFDEVPTGGGASRCFFYEGADLEAMLIDLGVMRHVLRHRGSSAKTSNSRTLDDVVSTIIECARWVGLVRAANGVHGWGLPFAEVSVASKVDRRSLDFDRRRFCDALRTACHSQVVPEGLYELIDTEPSETALYRGKDAAAMAGIALRAKLGSLSHSEATEEAIASAIRMSADFLLDGSDWISRLRAFVN